MRLREKRSKPMSKLPYAASRVNEEAGAKKADQQLVSPVGKEPAELQRLEQPALVRLAGGLQWSEADRMAWACG